MSRSCGLCIVSAFLVREVPAAWRTGGVYGSRKTDVNASSDSAGLGERSLGACRGLRTPRQDVPPEEREESGEEGGYERQEEM